MRTAKAKDGSVIITGTSRGIGFHLAKHFLKHGYRVIGISRTDTDIQHSLFQNVKADISDLDQISALSQLLAEERVIGLINNAGAIGPIGPLEKIPFDQWVRMFDVNLFGAAKLTQVVIPALRRSKGFVIFLSGGGSAFPRPNFSAYAVSKCAIVRLSETLALELAPDVSVYCVAPGPNRTQLLGEAIRNGEVVPESDIVGFEYVQQLCLFLAENEDNRYSGKFIHVKDSYKQWGDSQLEGEAYTLRRIKVV